MMRKIILTAIITIIISLMLLITSCAQNKIQEETDTNTSTETSQEQDNQVTGHGVIICGTDYPCGAQDNVCPEDYGAECEQKDPDCTTT